jgi:hypothetical protein
MRQCADDVLLWVTGIGIKKERKKERRKEGKPTFKQQQNKLGHFS